MAKQTSVNNTPTNGAFAMVDLFDLLILAGWTVQEESDGTTYEADVPTNGRQITSGNTGANGWDNTNAWSRIQDPGGARELIAQRTTNAKTWRLKYSALDKFVVGTPDATQVPGAADGQILIGSGTDAAPGGGTLFNTTINRWHCIAFDNANSRGVYPFWAFEVSTAQVADTVIFLDAIDPSSIPALVGTRAAPVTGDPDPVILNVRYSSSGGGFKFVNLYSVGASPLRSWFAMNGTNGNTEAWVLHTAGIHVLGAGVSFTPADGAAAGFGVSPYDSAEEGIPFPYGRSIWHVTQTGFKGYSEHLRIKAVDREYPNTVNLVTDAYIYIEDMLVPWHNGIVPL